MQKKWDPKPNGRTSWKILLLGTDFGIWQILVTLNELTKIENTTKLLYESRVLFGFFFSHFFLLIWETAIEDPVDQTIGKVHALSNAWLWSRIMTASKFCFNLLTFVQLFLPVDVSFFQSELFWSWAISSVTASYSSVMISIRCCCGSPLWRLPSNPRSKVALGVCPWDICNPCLHHSNLVFVAMLLLPLLLVENGSLDYVVVFDMVAAEEFFEEVAWKGNLGTCWLQLSIVKAKKCLTSSKKQFENLYNSRLKIIRPQKLYDSLKTLTSEVKME